MSEEFESECNDWDIEEIRTELSKYNRNLSGSKLELCRRLAEARRMQVARQSYVPVSRIFKPSPQSMPKTPVSKSSPKPISKVSPKPVSKVSPKPVSKVSPKPVSKPIPKDPSLSTLEQRKALFEREIEEQMANLSLRTTGEDDLGVKLDRGSGRGTKVAKYFTLQECQSRTVIQLREELKELELPTSGNKDKLCQRLVEYYASQLPETKNLKTIIIVDPINYQGPPENARVRRPYERIISVPERLYGLIKTGGQRLETKRGKKCQGFTLVFGPQFDSEDYQLLVSFPRAKDIYGFLLAILDYDQILKEGLSPSLSSPDIITNPPSEVVYLTAIDPDSEIRSFEVYIHLDRFGEADSIAIDFNCLFSD